jgi:DNA repair protein RecN (Recombination protein N)
VEALFDRLPEPLIAAREVAAGGRSTARLDDETVTAARLADEVGPLVEIHGQHDQQHLLDERWQRDLLDGFGGHGELRGAAEAAVAAWRANRTALDELVVDPRELARRLEVLEYEASEIAAAGIRPGEADEIKARLAAAQHGEAIARGAAAVHEALTADAGAREAVAGAVREARAIARLDGRFDDLAERLAGLEAELEDAAVESRTLAETVDHDPASLATLEERLGVIYSLERRYGDDEAAVIAHWERSAAEVERLRGVDGERARREADDERLLSAVGFAAAALSSARTEAAGRLSAAVGEVLVDLGFPAGVFEVAIGRRTAGAGESAVELDGDAVAFDAAGVDQVVYRLAPNAGEPFRPLARIASGGELSRVALAIKQVLAEADETPTLVFDEVDTGIGGRSADPVGRSLWTLARRHQVLCVTHLPQIAAHADAQFRITKRERDGRTVTEVERLDREGRIVELSQMLGSGAGAAAGLAAARELLDRAEAWRGASATVG